MKTICMTLLCLSITVLAGFSATGTSAQDVAQPEPESKDAKTKEKKDADAAVDAYGLYKKKGRSWTHKSATKVGDMDEQVHYMKYEVTKVGEDYATLKMTMLDKDKKAMGYVEPTETKIPFVVYEPGDRADVPKTEMKEETIEAVGRKWECLLFEIENGGIVTKSWTSKKYPALVIKMESKGESAGMKYNTTMELVEFNDGGQVTDKDDAAGEKGDPADEKGDPAGEKGADQAVDAYALYKKKGRKWKHKSTVTMEGMDPMVSFMSSEITKVADDHAVLKITMLDKDGKPMAGMEPTETKIEFRTADATKPVDAPKIETKEETVKVEAGEFECIVTDSYGTKAWSSKKYPGLLVKMESASMVTELVEWSE